MEHGRESYGISRYRGIKTEIAYPGGYGSATGIMITHTSPSTSVFYLSLPEHKHALTQGTDSPIKIPSWQQEQNPGPALKIICISLTHSKDSWKWRKKVSGGGALGW